MATDIRIGDVTASGAAGANVIAQQNNHYYSNSKQESLLKAFKAVDPEVQRNRIMAGKGKLLPSSCDWLIKHAKFEEWRCGHGQQNMLVIEGGPGKGKTMIMEAAIRELSAPSPGSQAPNIVAYTFCEAMSSTLNNATAILKGLIFSLVPQRPIFGEILSEDAYNTDDISFWTLWTLLSKLIAKSGVKSIYLCIDALDECRSDLPNLLKAFTTQHKDLTARWLVTTRQESLIHRNLVSVDSCVCIGLDEYQDRVDETLRHYISSKTNDLADMMDYRPERKAFVQNYLLQHAQGTFLWVALACEMLRSLKKRANVETYLTKMPAGLSPLYERMLQQIKEWNDEDDALLCYKVLRTLSILHQPPTLGELSIFSDVPSEFHEDVMAMDELIKDCGSLLRVTENRVYFVHQSAIDFCLQGGGMVIYAEGVDNEHGRLTRLLMEKMSKNLKNDICEVRWPGISVESMPLSRIDAFIPPLMQYACKFWVRHLLQARPVLEDQNKVHDFLHKHLLHWFEALSWMRCLSGIDGMLVSLCKLMATATHAEPEASSHETSAVVSLLEDAEKFLASFKSIIEMSPLQLYSSALVFAPSLSRIKQVFRYKIPSWIQIDSQDLSNWSISKRIYQRHLSFVNDVAFSGNDDLVASVSHDGTVCIWDPISGDTSNVFALETHLYSVAFSPTGDTVAVGTENCSMIIRLADGAIYRSRRDDRLLKRPHMAFSPDGKWFATITSNSIEMLSLQTFEWKELQHSPNQVGRSRPWAQQLSFSSCGRYLAALLGYPSKFFLRDMVQNREIDAFANLQIEELKFSPVSPVIVCKTESPDGWKHPRLPVRFIVWNIDERKLPHTFDTFSPQHNRIKTFDLSRDGYLMAYFNERNLIKLRDLHREQDTWTFEYHSPITNFTFSDDSKTLASSSKDFTIVLWDCVTGVLKAVLSGHTGGITSLAFSPNSPGLLASGSQDASIRLWDSNSATLEAASVPNEEESEYYNYEISHDTKYVAASQGHELLLWNVDSGARMEVSLDGVEPRVHFDLLGEQLFVVTSDMSMTVFSTSSLSVIRQLHLHSSLLRPSPKSPPLADIGQQQGIFHDLHSGDGETHTERPPDMLDAVFSPNGQFLVTIGPLISVLDTKSFSVLWSVPRSLDVHFSISQDISPCSKFLAVRQNNEQNEEVLETRDIRNGAILKTQHIDGARGYVEPKFPAGSQSDHLQRRKRKLEFIFSGSWLTLEDEPLIWIPVNARPVLADWATIRDGLVVFETPSHHTTILRLDLSQLALLEPSDVETGMMRAQAKLAIKRYT